MGAIFIESARAVVTMDPRLGVLADADVLVEDRRIRAVGRVVDEYNAGCT